MASLLTLNEAKLLLNLTDDSYDKLLITLISSVTAILETYCNRHFTAADYTEYHDGEGDDEILTNEWPINSIASIYDDPDREFSSITLIEATSYTYYANEGRVSLLNSGTLVGSNFRTTFYKGQNNIKITYNAGYSTIPEDLKLIASEVLGRKFKTVVDKRWGMSRVTSSGEEMYFIADDLTPENKRILDAKYRNRGTQ